jgi:hypothetical protein
VTDRETKTQRRRRSKRSYGHCRRRAGMPEAERLADPLRASSRDLGVALPASPARPAR